MDSIAKLQARLEHIKAFLNAGRVDTLETVGEASAHLAWLGPDVMEYFDDISSHIKELLEAKAGPVVALVSLMQCEARPFHLQTTATVAQLRTAVQAYWKHLPWLGEVKTAALIFTYQGRVLTEDTLVTTLTEHVIQATLWLPQPELPPIPVLPLPPV